MKYNYVIKRPIGKTKINFKCFEKAVPNIRSDRLSVRITQLFLKCSGKLLLKFLGNLETDWNKVFA